MVRNLNKTQKSYQSIFKQKGVTLIFLAFIIGLGATAYLLKSFSATALQANQERKTYQALEAAKQALISWAVNHPNTPGLMPYPDRNNDGNYDDTSDCYALNVNFSPSFTLGRLPLFKSDPNCVNSKNNVSLGLAEDFRDGAGERFWYEVSRNLLHDYKSTVPDPDGVSPIINPSIVNAPTYPWFVVRNRNGTVISDRVAAVIISPGTTSGTQDRSGGIANASEYLDKIVMADGTPYKNYGYQDAATNPIQEFIIGDDFRLVAKNDPTYQNQSIEPYYYNDKLVYITIDELMAALSRRAAAEAKAHLVNYKNVTGYYPYASALVLNEYYQRNAQYTGFLPIQKPTQTSFKLCSVSYTSANASSTSCDFTSVSSIEFTRTTGTFTSTTGVGCTRTNSNRTCSCSNITATSRCNGTGGRRFTCAPLGCSTTGSLPGKYVFNNAFKFSTGTPATVKVNNESGICTGCGTNTMTCTATAASNGSFSYSVTTTPADFNDVATKSTLPAWFTVNSWQDYLFYAVSSNCTYGQPCSAADINVGGKSSIQAMIASTGSPVISAPYAAKGSAQTHSGCDVKEYLDSTENTNLDMIFDATNKPKTSSYNDQTIVVSP